MHIFLHLALCLLWLTSHWFRLLQLVMTWRREMLEGLRQMCRSEVMFILVHSHPLSSIIHYPFPSQGSSLTLAALACGAKHLSVLLRSPPPEAASALSSQSSQTRCWTCLVRTLLVHPRHPRGCCRTSHVASCGTAASSTDHPNQWRSPSQWRWRLWHMLAETAQHLFKQNVWWTSFPMITEDIFDSFRFKQRPKFSVPVPIQIHITYLWIFSFL